MNRLFEKHKFQWSQKSFLFSALLAFLFLAASLFVNYAAGNYATEKASNSVTDIILDNLPIMNVNGIFMYGAILFGVFLVILLIKEPKQIPFIIKSAALFYFIRAIFISLTHLGPIFQQAPLVSNILSRNLIFGADYFFSGHTGLPFLMALMFWNNKYLRGIFLATSFIFGASALLGHFHYSIDVFAAFFITYGIFHIARWLFAKDYRLFLNSLHQDTIYE
ncbi:MAG: phosphatase PAP2-related protein [Candidatus Azambacteria bacterium]|nr:phosphatase PAP2-related protein [Candidatus Azambacteria bacterium]